MGLDAVGGRVNVVDAGRVGQRIKVKALRELEGARGLQAAVQTKQDEGQAAHPGFSSYVPQ